ncbi:MAG: hypothetical protein P8M22_09470 [Phycisphaerales bacterium]|nr:hypothetical protein [Phycisphaerales bacterium]
MNRYRRGLFHRITALLLAVAMPLCCCMINSASGASCCDVEPIMEVASCCSSSHCQAAPEDNPPADPCVGITCQCCLKAPSNAFDWTPPVDTIGSPLDQSLFSFEQDAWLQIDADTIQWDDPPPVACSPGMLRGNVILQV